MSTTMKTPFAKILGSDIVKSYVTEDRLRQALVKADLQNHRILICKTTDNRWTAVILGSTAINGEGTPGRGAALGTGFMIAS